MNAFEQACLNDPVISAAIRVRAAQGKRHGAAVLANSIRQRLGQSPGHVPGPGMFDPTPAVTNLVERHGAAAAADAEDEYHQAREEATSN